MAREERTVEVTLISATDLKKVKKFGGEQKCYVTAYIYSARRQTTANDPYGGVNPTWNATLKLACYETDVHPDAGESASGPPHAVTMDIYSHGGGIFHKTDKLVGTVTVPLQRVVAAAKAGGTLPPFEVHLPSGAVQGSLNLSVKLGGKRELAEFEDLSAALLPSYNNDQEFASASSGNVPSFQPASYAPQGQSSSGTYPPAKDHPSSAVPYPPTASPNKTPSAAEGPPQHYGPSPPPNTNTYAAEQGQSSYGNNPPPTSAYPPPRSSYPPPTAPAPDDVVMGYPAPEYAFAPLGQLPPQRQQQQGPGTSYQDPFAGAPQGIGYQTRRERKRVRRGAKRTGRGGRRRGPIGLGLTVLHGIFAPMAMMMTGHGKHEQQPGASNDPAGASSSSSQPGPGQRQDPGYGPGKSQGSNYGPGKMQDPDYGPGKRQF